MMIGDTHLVFPNRVTVFELLEMLPSRDIPTFCCTHPCDNCLDRNTVKFVRSGQSPRLGSMLMSDIKLAHEPLDVVLQSKWHTAGSRI
jgi:hypothetical protein